MCTYRRAYIKLYGNLGRSSPRFSYRPCLFFLFFTDNTGRNVRTAKVHLYADDTIIYSVASSLTRAVNESQTAFQQLQALLYRLKLVINAKKNKQNNLMIFSRARSQTSDNSDIHPWGGMTMESVSSFKCLCLGLMINLIWWRNWRLSLVFVIEIRPALTYQSGRRNISKSLGVPDFIPKVKTSGVGVWSWFNWYGLCLNSTQRKNLTSVFVCWNRENPHRWVSRNEFKNFCKSEIHIRESELVWGF